MKKFKGFNKSLVYALVTWMVLSCGAGNRVPAGSACGHDRDCQRRCTECPFRCRYRLFPCGDGNSGNRRSTYWKQCRARMVIHGTRCPEQLRGMFGVILSLMLFQIHQHGQPVPQAATTADWLNVRTGAGTNFSVWAVWLREDV